MAEVYVIVNESTPVGVNIVLTEIISPARWTLQEAMDDLADIARSAGVELEPDATSVYVPVTGSHLETDEYYIYPMEVLERG